jgi:Polyketide cyclase / dehydrase and lipid transport
MNRLLVATSCAALAGAVVTGAYIGVVTGRLTFDLGLGRRTRPLGPFHLDIAAPRETVFAVAAAPYADRQPRAMREKVEILERAGQMVLAAHRTPVGSGLTAVTVETVTLDPPKRMGFRLLRGPVPHVTETFTFDETADGTRLSYSGELGTDLWRLGQAWGDLVARSWVDVVRDSMATIKTESERRAQG